MNNGNTEAKCKNSPGELLMKNDKKKFLKQIENILCKDKNRKYNEFLADTYPRLVIEDYWKKIDLNTYNYAVSAFLVDKLLKIKYEDNDAYYNLNCMNTVKLESMLIHSIKDLMIDKKIEELKKDFV